jgi:hypothetical protein
MHHENTDAFAYSCLIQAHVYSSENVHTNGSISGNSQFCSAFLANIDEHKYASVWIFGKSYSLPPWSVSILPDCETVAFNTARVRGLYMHILFLMRLQPVNNRTYLHTVHWMAAL